jgi:uncharacterized membrane protein YphA (DoxX/SURF4 family)
MEYSHRQRVTNILKINSVTHFYRPLSNGYTLIKKQAIMEKSSAGLSQIQTILKLTYGLIPIIAGADKFTNLLTNWVDYLNPSLTAMLPFSAATFMMVVGVIEIIAGLMVFIDVQKGAYLVSVWLVLIAITLITSGRYLDVAVRDLAMAIGAYSLAKISGILKGTN